MTGKGLQADGTATTNAMSVYVPGTKSKGGRVINPYPYMSPPFVGTWNNPVGMEVKNRGQGLLQKQSIQFNPNSRNNTVKFINKPLSNIDLLHWVKQLGIKYFKDIL